MCTIVTIVSLIFLNASKLFITEMLMEKKNMSGRLSHTLGLGKRMLTGNGFQHHKQLGTYLLHHSNPAFSKARKSLPTGESWTARLGSGPQAPASSSLTCNSISAPGCLKPTRGISALPACPTPTRRCVPGMFQMMRVPVFQAFHQK